MATPPTTWNAATSAPGGPLYDSTGAIVGPSNPLLVATTASSGTLANITTGTTTLVKTGAGVLYSVTINTLVASATIKLYAGLTAVNIFATITLPSTITGVVPFTLPYNVAFTTGLTIVTSGATDVTVSFS